MTSPRTARVERVTSESSVLVEVNLDGTGASTISTGVGFYDHMLSALSRHSLIDLTVQTTGDLHIDGHHCVEDTAIALGQALKQALGDKRGISRFGSATVPLDEALATAVVDVAGRPYVVCSGEPAGYEFVAIRGSGVPYMGSMTRHVVEALAYNAGLCVHLTLLAGRDPHHIAEAQYKALARGLRQAVEPDPRVTGIPSTKGTL
ncbi:MAG: imidazoleglycerol-phosphate dehydratase HisB [Propionibacteriaceae bacterium]|nr:imidazoleglycerol-phosphate dehydratase HisB [Propionibacteriaceae bacterium]